MTIIKEKRRRRKNKKRKKEPLRSEPCDLEFYKTDALPTELARIL